MNQNPLQRSCGTPGPASNWCPQQQFPQAQQQQISQQLQVTGQQGFGAQAIYQPQPELWMQPKYAQPQQGYAIQPFNQSQQAPPYAIPAIATGRPPVTKHEAT